MRITNTYSKSNDTLRKWASVILSIGIAINSAIFTAIVYAHGNFVTVREKEDITARLDRIENKIDFLLEAKKLSGEESELYGQTDSGRSKLTGNRSQ
jgi:hypothetical protein